MFSVVLFSERIPGVQSTPVTLEVARSEKEKDTKAFNTGSHKSTRTARKEVGNNLATKKTSPHCPTNAVFETRCFCQGYAGHALQFPLTAFDFTLECKMAPFYSSENLWIALKRFAALFVSPAFWLLIRVHHSPTPFLYETNWCLPFWYDIFFIYQSFVPHL